MCKGRGEVCKGVVPIQGMCPSWEVLELGGPRKINPFPSPQKTQKLLQGFSYLQKKERFAKRSSLPFPIASPWGGVPHLAAPLPLISSTAVLLSPGLSCCPAALQCGAGNASRSDCPGVLGGGGAEGACPRLCTASPCKGYPPPFKGIVPSEDAAEAGCTAPSSPCLLLLFPANY